MLFDDSSRIQGAHHRCWCRRRGRRRMVAVELHRTPIRTVMRTTSDGENYFYHHSLFCRHSKLLLLLLLIYVMFKIYILKRSNGSACCQVPRRSRDSTILSSPQVNYGRSMAEAKPPLRAAMAALLSSALKIPPPATSTLAPA